MKKFIILLFVFLFSTLAKAEAPSELDCLAKVIYHEARGETYEGKIAVAWVVMNRLTSNRFGDTICNVVYQKSQFSWTSWKHHISDWDAYNYAETLAMSVIYEVIPDPTHGALFFNARGIRPSRSSRLTVKLKNHYFYQ